MRATPPIRAFLWSVPIAVLGGLIGLGGAEFRLPVLVGVLRHPPRAAVPLNLAVSLATIAASLFSRGPTIPSVAPYRVEVLALAVGGVVAAFFGASWARLIPEAQLRRTILVLLSVIGLALIVEAFVPSADGGLLPPDPAIRFVIGIIFGLGIGLVSSILGVAGGEVIIPTLLFGFGLDVKVAGTASLLISTPTVLTGIGRYASRGAYRDRAGVQLTVLPMAIGSVLGAAVGGLALGLVPAAALKFALGVILIWSAQRIFRAH